MPSTWTRIQDNSPIDNQWCYVWYNGAKLPGIGEWRRSENEFVMTQAADEHANHEGYFSLYGNDVTHWMPLPEVKGPNA